MGCVRFCKHPRDDDDDEDHGREDHGDEDREEDLVAQGAGCEAGPGQAQPQGREQEGLPHGEEEGHRALRSVSLSAELAAICGGKKMPRTEVTKKLWAYIKAKKLNEGRIVKPDGALKAIFPVAKLDMLKMPAFVGKHLSK